MSGAPCSPGRAAFFMRVKQLSDATYKNLKIISGFLFDIPTIVVIIAVVKWLLNFTEDNNGENGRKINAHSPESENAPAD
jgi:hypothetical protein